MPSALLVPAAVSAAIAGAITLAASSSSPPERVDAFDHRTPVADDLEAEVAALKESQEQLLQAVDALSMRFTAMDAQARSASREAVETASPGELSEDLAKLAKALSGKGGAPGAFDDWLSGQLEAREDARRAERRSKVQERLDEMLAENIDDLAERLDLAPHQTNQVEDILTSSFADVSTVIADADSPLDIMRGIAPIQEERNTQLQSVLTPEQFTSFQAEESAFRTRSFTMIGGGN